MSTNEGCGAWSLVIGGGDNSVIAAFFNSVAESINFFTESVRG